MDYLISLLISYGYWGMLVTAFVAGSFFPFSSEAVMTGLLAAGLDPWLLIVYGTIGNVAGGMFNYCIGRMGRLEWIEKYLHVKQKDLDRATKFMAGRGAWMGFFALRAHSGLCHHRRTGSDARQHTHIADEHGDRQIPTLRCPHLRCEPADIALKILKLAALRPIYITFAG